MIEHTKDIFFTLVHGEYQTNISTYEGEFRNLMILINEKIYVEDFGECRGTGRCGTCLVEIANLAMPVEMQRNEERTIEKSSLRSPNLRLSCQLMIDKSLQNSIIRIVEEREDLR